LGIGDWGLGPIPNPQSPIPNPQSPIYSKYKFKRFLIIHNFNQLFIVYLIKRFKKRNT